MTPRERLRTALNHRTPDRIPVDFGATAVTGMHVTCVAQLRDALGLPRRPVKVCEPYQMLGEIEDDLREALELDTVPLPGPKTIFGFRNENWREFRAPWGQELLVSEHFVTTADANGELLLYPEGDRNAPPSGRLPVGGYFFDTIVRQEPIDEDRLDPVDNLEEFAPLADVDVEYFRREAARLRGSAHGVVGGVGGTAFGDIALVPAPFLKHPKGIRDIAEWYMATASRRDYIHAVFAGQCEVALQNLERLRPVLADALDVCFVCGTDFGTQSSSFCSPATFDELYAPYYRRINAWIHANTAWKTFKHSCGAVAPFLEPFIACGFDIVNPVQCSAVGMDPALLKERVGDRLVFWGGGVDTQKTLPFGTPQEVRSQVLERCRVFAAGGGFVFNTVHNVQARTPVANLVAMFNALREFNGQPALQVAAPIGVEGA
jgi:hypothetical protein